MFAYSRVKDENKVVVFLNLSKKSVAIKPVMENLNGDFTEYFSGVNTSLPFTDSLRIEPWGYKIFVR